MEFNKKMGWEYTDELCSHILVNTPHGYDRVASFVMQHNGEYSGDISRDENLVKNALDARYNGPSRWYHFTVSRWVRENDDDPFSKILAEASVVELQQGEKPSARGLRELNETLYDYPDIGCLWAGFVLTESEKDALLKIEAAH